MAQRSLPAHSPSAARAPDAPKPDSAPPAVTTLNVAGYSAGSALPGAGELGVLRTRVMLLAASGALVVVAAAAGCLTSAAVLLAVLEAVVVLACLRAPQRAALTVSLLAALAFIALRVGTWPVVADPAAPASPSLLDEGAWASALLGAGALLASSALALWCAEALRISPTVAPPPARDSSPRGADVVGPARADWMLAEARRGHRLVTMGLIGVDAPADYELEPGEREAVMGQLDELLSGSLAGLEALSEYGPWERLVVLPDVWAEDFREQAANLVKTARQHIRRPVRVALITFPLDGPGASEPFEYLERALEVCRAGRSSVSVGRPRLRNLTPNPEIA